MLFSWLPSSSTKLIGSSGRLGAAGCLTAGPALWKRLAEVAGALIRLCAPGLFGPTMICDGKQVAVAVGPTVPVWVALAVTATVGVRVAVGGVPVAVGVAVPPN